MTFKIAEDIKVELFGSTSFIIGQSKLGGPALLGNLTPTWHPLTCGVVSVDIDRGFSVNQGILPSLEVGTANIVLSGFDVDPTLNPLFDLNHEIRVLVRAPGTTEFSPIFTGFVDDIQTSYAADGQITTSLTCTDWLSKIMNITVDAELYIAPEQNFAERANYLIDTFVLPAYPNIDISPAWFDIYGGSIFPEETGFDRTGFTTTGELFQEIIEGEAGMIVASRTGVVYGFGRWYYDYLKEQLDLGTVGNDFGFSNVHSSSLDHFCMGDVETLFGKSDVVNEVTLGFSSTANGFDDKVVKKNEVSIAALGHLPTSIDLYVSPGDTGDDLTYLQSWADDLTLPEGNTRINSITWSPIRRDGLLNNSWNWDPGAKVVRVRVSETLNDKYIVSKLNHSITPENWVIRAELWKGI
jgi:hypothetical protein